MLAGSLEVGGHVMTVQGGLNDVFEDKWEYRSDVHNKHTIFARFFHA